MALKTCPNCQTKCGPKKKTCPNINCNYQFPVKGKTNEDEDDDFEDDIPERNCSICGDVYRPAITKRSASGQPYYVWHYNNYCSSGCFENAESKLFDFIFDLIKESKLDNIPTDISNIVNTETFALRKVDSLNINYAAFIQLISPQRKHIPATVECPSDFEKVEKPVITPEEFEEKFGRKPPKKSLDNIEEDYPEDSLERQVSDLTNLPLGDYLDQMLDDPSISIEAKKDLKPGPGQKKCANKDCGKITGVRKLVCDGCGYKFPVKS